MSGDGGGQPFDPAHDEYEYHQAKKQRTGTSCAFCGEPDVYYVHGKATCTNMECVSNGGGGGTPEVNWEARFAQQVADNVRTTERHRKRLGAAQLELDRLRRENDRLRLQIRDLQPSGSRLEAAVQEQHRLRERYNQELRGLHKELDRLRGIIQGGRAEVVRKLIADLSATLPADKKVDTP